MSQPLPAPILNSYSYQSYQRQRQLTLGDLLLENRIVFLQGEIYTANANDVVMKLLYLQSENRRKDIHFYLNSPGGDVVSTLAIYDTMQILSCPVATYCVGQAASGAAVLLTGGTKGKRYALPHARVMLHQPYGGVGGTGQRHRDPGQRDPAESADAQRNPGQPFRPGNSSGLPRIPTGISSSRAEEAKNYGLVDEILKKPLVEAEGQDDKKK